MSDLSAGFAKRFPLIYSLFTTRLKFSLAGLAAVFAATAYGQYAVVVGTSDALFTKYGPIIGGDFFIFYRAALVAGGPHMVDIYEMSKLSAMLREAYPGHGSMLFGWQYPPTMSLLVKPFSLAPYLPSFALWVALFGAMLVAVLHRIWPNRLAIFIAVASPAVFLSAVSGQTGLLTASLLAAAAYYADRRPILAGLAAALLTVKPQLGLLLPIAFVAGRCWRGFAAAAIASLAFIGASALAFGVEPWQAFFNSVTAHADRLGGGRSAGFPSQTLITPFGAASLLGLPKDIGFALQAAAALAMAAYVALVWRRTTDVNLRLAAIGTAAPLATPYAFYYEAAFLVPPLFALAKHASDTGWLRGERGSLIALWCASLLTPGGLFPSFPIAALTAVGAFLVVARRTIPAAGLSILAPTAMRRADS